MNALPAFAINLWLAGAPVVCVVAGLVTLLRRAPARIRYVVAVTGFALAIVAPVLLTREAAPVITTGAPSGAADASFDIAVTATAAWFAGVLVLLVREARAYRRLSLDRRSWRTADPITTRRSRYRVVLAGDGAPRTHGLLRPVIVLPEAIAAAEDGIARLVVAHEESHARWRDPMIHAAIRLVRSLLWIALPLWIAERIVIREREASADEAALNAETGEMRSRYAEALVEFCRSSTQRSALAVQLGAAADLEYRVRRILRTSSGAKSVATALGLLCAGSFLFAFTPLAEVPGEVVVEQASTVERPNDVRNQVALRSPASAGTATITGQPGADSSAKPADVRAEPEEVRLLATARSISEVSSGSTEADRASDAHAESPSPLTPLPREEGKETVIGEAARLVADRKLDEDVIVIRNGVVIDVVTRDVRRHRHVVKGDGARVEDDSLSADTGRSMHPVALFHRGVTAPIKRLARRARGAG